MKIALYINSHINFLNILIIPMRNRLPTFTYVTRQPNILGPLLCPGAKTELRLYKEFSDNIISFEAI